MTWFDAMLSIGSVLWLPLFVILWIVVTPNPGGEDRRIRSLACLWVSYAIMWILVANGIVFSFTNEAVGPVSAWMFTVGAVFAMVAITVVYIGGTTIELNWRQEEK